MPLALTIPVITSGDDDDLSLKDEIISLASDVRELAGIVYTLTESGTTMDSAVRRIMENLDAQLEELTGGDE